MSGGAPTAAAAAAALRAALAGRESGRTRLVVLPAGVAPAELLWGADPAAPATFWETSEGTWAGLGEAMALEGAGPDRLRQVAAALERVRVAGWETNRQPPAPPPAFFGGAAFAPGAAAAAGWAGFGDARFVLPRWTYHLAGGRAELTLALRPGPARLDELEGELAAILRALRAPPPGRDAAGGVVGLREEDEESWGARVAAVRAAIAAGRVRKVVLVRRTEVRLASRPAGGALLGRLGGEGAGLYRFGFRRGGAVFAGASPELLVARRGAEVRAEALAASVPRPAGADSREVAALAARLLADAKQRHEHELVVEALRRELRPLCRGLVAPAAPEVRALRRLLHLSTPVRGTLAAEVPLLELAARLHPTPAVAGEPRAEALEFLARHEGHPRGWFAGPVGRVTADGDGELAVALRSVLVRGRRAFVYAGAGIVAGSRAEAELAETRVKAHTCLAALGVPE